MKIHQQRISPKHEDSFWYDGIIAETNDWELRAEGIIDIRSSQSEFRCNGFKSWDEQNAWENGLNDPNKADDDDLAKIGANTTDPYYWENNNWFAIYSKDTGEDGGIFSYYTEALDALKELG